MTKRKLLIVGLDGATFDILEPLMKLGLLPRMEHAIQKGVKARLQSTIPPVTGPAWVSFMTGKNPENHGIFDFVTSAAKESLARRIIHYGDIKSNTLWSILTRKGKKVGLINMPITFPLPKLDGFAIPGMLTPGNVTEWTNPPHLMKELKPIIGSYIPDVWWQLYNESRIVPFLHRLISSASQKARISSYLMTKYDWDFLMTVFTGTDRIQHALWDLISIVSKGGNLGKGRNKIEHLIRTYYRKIDNFIGDTIQKIDDKTQLFILSDHGFGPLKGKFSINNWLTTQGFLAWNEKKVKRLNARNRILRTIGKMDVFKLRRTVFSKVTPRQARMKAYDFLECIDWSKTRAYAASNTEQGIYINLIGREPYGIVEPGGEYEKTRNEIIAELKRIKSPDSKDGLVSTIHKREEVYDQGKFVSHAPDIIFFLKDGEYLADVQLKDHLFEETSWKTGSGTHRMEGIFIGYGNDIQKGVEADALRIIDIAPTILNIFNIPVPDDMDGNVRTEIFTKSFADENPVRYTETKDERTALSDDATVYSDEEEASIRSQLKDLGYL